MPSMNRGTYQLKPDDPPSVRNLWERYRDLEEQFPPELSGEALPYFHDWLLHRVGLVGIEAHDQGHGWEIFETMNDRPQPAAAPQRGRDHQVWLRRMVTIPAGSRRAITTPAAAVKVSRSPGCQPSVPVMARSPTRPDSSIRPVPYTTSPGPPGPAAPRPWAGGGPVLPCRAPVRPAGHAAG